MKKIYSLLIIPLLILSGCAEVDLSSPTNDNQTSKSSPQPDYEGYSSNIDSFKGERGLYVELDSIGATIEASSVNDGNAHFFNTMLPNNKPAYFFIVKSPDGKLRAAANGCQVCGNALQGFRQEGDFMVCNTCGNKYPFNKISTEKGGCNPVPISPNLEIQDGKINISVAELNNIQHFFN